MSETGPASLSTSITSQEILNNGSWRQKKLETFWLPCCVALACSSLSSYPPTPDWTIPTKAKSESAKTPYWCQFLFTYQLHFCLWRQKIIGCKPTQLPTLVADSSFSTWKGTRQPFTPSQTPNSHDSAAELRSACCSWQWCHITRP